MVRPVAARWARRPSRCISTWPLSSAVPRPRRRSPSRIGSKGGVRPQLERVDRLDVVVPVHEDRRRVRRQRSATRRTPRAARRSARPRTVGKPVAAAPRRATWRTASTSPACAGSAAHRRDAQPLHEAVEVVVARLRRRRGAPRDRRRDRRRRSWADCTARSRLGSRAVRVGDVQPPARHGAARGGPGGRTSRAAAARPRRGRPRAAGGRRPRSRDPAVSTRPSWPPNALGARWWRFVPTVLGTPGVRGWRLPRAPDGQGCRTGPTYGLALVSRLPVREWRVRRFAAAPGRLPLLVPAPGGRPRVVLVPDEPRVAARGSRRGPHGPFTVVATHLSFVPGFNVRQLRSIARWAADLPRPAFLLGDLNLPPAAASAAHGLAAPGASARRTRRTHRASSWTMCSRTASAGAACSLARARPDWR